jgi:hypothetical protein
VNGISGAIKGEIYLETALYMQTDLVCSNIFLSKLFYLSFYCLLVPLLRESSPP